MASEEKHRNKEFERVDPVRTESMAGPRETSNDYTLVPESILEPAGRRRVTFVVAETGGDNAVDARIVKRIRNDAGEPSPWVPDSGPEAEKTGIGSGRATALRPVATSADAYAIEVRSNTADWHGDIEIFGVSRAKH